MVPFRRGEYLPFLFALISSVWADYYIDDTNTTLTYSSGPKAAWGPFAIGAETLQLLLPNGTYQVIDAFACYNHTYRYAACFSTDTCLLTIPFTGSGVTVYVYQAGPVGINASINIDNTHPQTKVLNAPSAPGYKIANVSMFDVQQLPSGPHTLQLLVNNLFGSYSGMMFDYAYINESLVTNVTTTSSSATGSAASPTSALASSASHNNVGAIVGGAVGAVVLVAIGFFALLWVRRRRRRAPEAMDHHSDGPPSRPHTGYDPLFINPAGTYDPYAEHNSQANNASRNDLNPSRSTELPSRATLAPNRFDSPEMGRSTSALSGGQDTVTPFTVTSSDSSGTYKSRLVLSNDIGSTPMPPSQSGRHSPLDSRQETTPLLTDEQADFINSLHQNNVPAAAIARVMERMLVDRNAGIREWERETRLARSNTMTTAPPSYDSVAERG